jgi:hypothetical protein
MKRILRASVVIGAILSSSALINHYPANAAVVGFRLNAYGEYTGDNTDNFVSLGFLSGSFEGEDTNGDNEISANELSSFFASWKGNNTVPDFERNLNSGGIFEFRYLLGGLNTQISDKLYFNTNGSRGGTGIFVDNIGIKNYVFPNIPGQEPELLPLRTAVAAVIGTFDARSTYAPEVFSIRNPIGCSAF